VVPFRRLWASTAVTAIGSQLTAVAVPKQVYDITNSSGYVGLAGAVQVGLLPAEAGYLVIFVALIGLGMELPMRLALVAGLIVFAGANLSFLVAARLSPENIIGNDVGATFLFTLAQKTGESHE